jgi:hypothetical protein
MTTTPLLPPDPEKSGLYYLAHNGGPPRVWEWSADACGTGGWIAGDGRICRPEHVGAWGYTLAPPHRIPTPGELEAVYALADTLRDLANDAVIPHQGAHIVGQETFSAAGARVKALREAAAMLRAALGGGA